MAPTSHTILCIRRPYIRRLFACPDLTVKASRFAQALTSWLLMAVLLALTGCASPPKNPTEESRPEPPKPIQLNARYNNKALSFSMRFDQSWHFFAEQESKKMHNEGEPLTIESSADDRQVATISRFSPDQPSQFNDNLTITAENVAHYPDIESSSDYLVLLKDTLGRTQTGITFGNLHTTKLNATEYAVLPVSYNIYGIKIHQSHYVTLRKGKIIGFILTYAVRNRKADLIDMLNSVHFLDN